MTNIIKSSHEVAHIKVVRAKSDDFSLVVLYSEDDTPVDLQDKDIRLFFFDPKREFVILSVPPSDINSNVATFTLTKQETIRLPNDTCKLSIKIDGRTRAHGTFSWAYDYADEPSDIHAIGINYRTLTEDTVWFDVLLGPTGKSAYQYAVDGGYTGTKEDFEQAMADLPHARDEAVAAKEEAVAAKLASEAAQLAAEEAQGAAEEAQSLSESARDASIAARNISVSAKEEAEDARDIAVNAKGEAVAAKLSAEDARDIAESARDTAVGAANTAVSAKEDAEDAKQDAETAKGLAESARDAAILAKNDAESAKDTAVGAMGVAVSAKEDAEDARDVAIQAKGDAELAAQAAEEDRDEAEQFRDQAEGYRDEAEGYRDESEQFRDEAEYFAYLTGLGSPLWYGVEWDVTVAATELTRIGNMDMHRELPIQNNRFGCVLKDDGTINYKLYPNNWAYQYNGQPSVRDGTDGQVGIWQNEYWARCETEGNIRRLKLSPFALPGYFRVQPYFRGAYEATVYRPQNKLSSVANDTPDYRGGNNNDAWDGDDRSLLGVPASNINRTDFQTYARNRGTGWEMEPWWVYLSEWWLYLSEYANRNCQLPFTPSLTVDGFRQGGLGEGVTNINSAAWTAWKSQYGFVPCGYTDDIGVFSGEKSFEMPAGYGSALITYIPRWRGIECPFGHLWKWVNGINILIQSDSDGGKSYAYRSDNPANWSDSSNVDYRLVGEVAREQNYMTDVVFGESGDLLPSQTGGSSSTFWADRWYTSLPSSGVSLRGLRVGGSSSTGEIAGLGCLNSASAPSTTSAIVSSRLCYLPEHPLLIS